MRLLLSIRYQVDETHGIQTQTRCLAGRCLVFSFKSGLEGIGKMTAPKEASHGIIMRKYHEQ